MSATPTEWPTVPKAAQFMKVSRATAWRRLKAFQEANPSREILRSYPGRGKRVGKLLVCPQALLEVMRAEREDTVLRHDREIDTLETRVGSLETLAEVIRIRLKKLERGQKTLKDTQEAMDLEQRLVSLGCISLQNPPLGRGQRDPSNRSPR